MTPDLPDYPPAEPPVAAPSAEPMPAYPAAAETRKERKARLKAEKQAAKADAKVAKAEAKAALSDKEVAKARKKAAEQAARDEKMARYRRLRANVRRRRAFYVLFILLAIAVFAATVWDMVFNAADLEWWLLPAYVVLFVLAVLLLISRRRHLEEVNEIKALERSWMECDNCRSVFQFGSESFLSRRRVGFTCPVCGDESALPLPGAEPVERALPPGHLHEVNYVCGNCKEDIVVGTYGSRPRDVDFRACPKCGVTGQIQMSQAPA
jgi:predicted RNA-binding Zn-ribbon protein involved in translation (DUF1610 family)